MGGGCNVRNRIELLSPGPAVALCVPGPPHWLTGYEVLKEWPGLCVQGRCVCLCLLQNALPWAPPGQASLCLTHLLACMWSETDKHLQAAGSSFLEKEPKVHSVVMAMGRGNRGTGQSRRAFPFIGIQRLHQPWPLLQGSAV